MLTLRVGNNYQAAVGVKPAPRAPSCISQRDGCACPQGQGGNATPLLPTATTRAPKDHRNRRAGACRWGDVAVGPLRLPRRGHDDHTQAGKFSIGLMPTDERERLPGLSPGRSASKAGDPECAVVFTFRADIRLRRGWLRRWDGHHGARIQVVADAMVDLREVRTKVAKNATTPVEQPVPPVAVQVTRKPSPGSTSPPGLVTF